MSDTAKNGFSLANWEILEASYKVITADIKTIEKIGGGSARCMVAEVFS